MNAIQPLADVSQPLLRPRRAPKRHQASTQPPLIKRHKASSSDPIVDMFNCSALKQQTRDLITSIILLHHDPTRATRVFLLDSPNLDFTRQVIAKCPPNSVHITVVNCTDGERMRDLAATLGGFQNAVTVIPGWARDHLQLTSFDVIWFDACSTFVNIWPEVYTTLTKWLLAKDGVMVVSHWTRDLDRIPIWAALYFVQHLFRETHQGEELTFSGCVRDQKIRNEFFVRGNTAACRLLRRNQIVRTGSFPLLSDEKRSNGKVVRMSMGHRERLLSDVDILRWDWDTCRDQKHAFGQLAKNCLRRH